ncbi:hypothetical protein B0H34DRAFT_795592 [Crassisporium funariophilum]|nr:hypothetical protein B0H34DRAFT_795592 [Crassisporium funariophilum]
MQSILSRIHDLLLPFNCLFVTAAPVQLKDQADLRPPPELPIELWLEIFQFATYVHRSATIKPLDPFTLKHTTTNVMGANTPTAAMRTKLALVLVSRSWRRVAVQMLYQHLMIRSPARATNILQVLEASRHMPDSFSSLTSYGATEAFGYGQCTRHIEIYTFTRGAGDIRYLHTLFKIFRLCPNLRTLSGTWMHRLPIEFLEGVSGLYASSLSALYWNEKTESLSENSPLSTPEFLGSFKSLRVLDLRHFIGVNPLSRSSCPPSATTLPLLQDLILSTHSRSLEYATILCMPSLRNLTLHSSTYDATNDELLPAFLKAHGPSLITVDLPSPSLDFEPDSDSTITRGTATHLNPDIFLKPDHCPNLESLTFPATSPALAPHTHPSLRRIGLRGVRSDGLYPDKPTSTKIHLFAISSNKYPRLELIQTVGFLVEADTDGLIKDIFIWWVEKFEKEGINFLDGEGVLWAYAEPDHEEIILAKPKDPTPLPVTFSVSPPEKSQNKGKKAKYQHE